MKPETFSDILKYQEGVDSPKAAIVSGSLADRLRQLWSEVLEQPAKSIQLQTSFFALGGDSIAVIRVVSLAKRIGLTLTVRGIINAKTLGNLVALVEQQLVQESSPKTSSVDINRSRPSTEDIVLPYDSLLKARLRDQPSARIVDAYYFSPMQRRSNISDKSTRLFSCCHGRWKSGPACLVGRSRSRDWPGHGDRWCSGSRSCEATS